MKLLRLACPTAILRESTRRVKTHVARIGILACLLGSALLFPSSLIAQADLLGQPLTQRWRVDQIEGLAIAGEVGSDRAYVVIEGGAVVAVRVSDGKLLWRSEFGGQIGSIPVAAGNGVYLASESGAAPSTNGSGQLRQLSHQSGITVWSTALKSPWVETIAYSPSSLYGCGRDGRLQAVNRTDGKLLWTADRQVQCSIAPVADNGHIFAADSRGDIVAVNPTTGGLMWRFRTQNVQIKRLSVDAFNVYAASADGAVYAIDLIDVKLSWSARTGAGTQFMAATPEGILVTSLDNFVYCLRARNGQRRWKFKLDGRPTAEPLINGHSMLVLSSLGNEGVVLELRSGKPINRLVFQSPAEPTGNPMQVDDHVILPTRQGLLAFASTASPGT